LLHSGLSNVFQDMTQESPDKSNPAGRPEALPSIEREAIEWLVRLSSGEAGPAERNAFAQWRARSPEHEAALAMARRLWLSLGQALPARHRVRPRPRWTQLALAASLLLVLGLGYQVFHGRNGQAGGTRPLEVADAGGRCRLTLGGGDAYFDVTPNPRLVDADAEETEVRVSDAAFSVRPERSGVVVTVTGGRVEVADGNAERVLAAGQQLLCRASHQAEAPSGPGTVIAAAPRPRGAA
jgi:transmembrane sensor